MPKCNGRNIYFDGEGKRFVLGKFKAKDPDKFRDVDRVINPASVAEIGALLKKIPDVKLPAHSPKIACANKVTANQLGASAQ